MTEDTTTNEKNKAKKLRQIFTSKDDSYIKPNKIRPDNTPIVSKDENIDPNLKPSGWSKSFG